MSSLRIHLVATLSKCPVIIHQLVGTIGQKIQQNECVVSREEEEWRDLVKRKEISQVAWRRQISEFWKKHKIQIQNEYTNTK